MTDSIVVVDDCLAAPSREAIHLRRSRTKYGDRNFVFEAKPLFEGLSRLLTPIEQDWLELLAALYATDKLCPRGAGIDYNRRITLHLPVREPTHWAPFISRIERLYGELTLDSLSLDLQQASVPESPPRQRDDPFAPFDAICLFSGGVDSFAGAVQLTGSGRTPLLVSHAASGAIDRAIKELAVVANPPGAEEPRRMTARLVGVDAEGSERSRSMLYMGVAGLIAAVSGTPDVYLNENGIMAIHVPIAASRAGSFSTKTANPFMRDMARLCSDALGCQVNISNILLARTKPEVVDDVRRAASGAANLLARSVSCFSIGRRQQHCGWCVPCLIRRVSFEFAGVLDATYLQDPWDSPPHTPEAEDNLGQLLSFAQVISNASDSLLERRFCEMHNTGPDLGIAESYDMHRRWAAQVLDVARNHSHSRTLLP